MDLKLKGKFLPNYPKEWTPNGKILFSPNSSESIIPLVVVDTQVKFNLFLQVKQPFGLLIRVPFVWVRWGSA